MIDWNLVALLAGPIVGGAVGVPLARMLERRVKLISFIAHTSGITTVQPNGQPLVVHTHTVVVRNTGKLPAHNVRLGHAYLPPAFSIYPPTEHHVVNHPRQGSDIVVPVMGPGDQITVAYLYFPPITWNQINRDAKCDEGNANVIRVLLQPVAPRWLLRLGLVLILIGIATLLYLVATLVLAALSPGTWQHL